MIDPQATHHRASALPCGHDRATHRIPRIHERERTGGFGSDTPDGCPGRPDRGKIHADASALLQGDGRFAKVFEDPREIVRYGSHHEAIEQRDVPARAGARQDAPCGNEAEVAESLPEPRPPLFAHGGFLSPRDSLSDAIKRCRQISVFGICRSEAILRAPDFLSERHIERHLSCPVTSMGETG